MIDKDEINPRAKAEGLRFDQVEKDHVILWILHALSQPGLKPEGWIFKGGTYLRHCFYAGYRFSEDLDFSCRQMPEGFNSVLLRGSQLTRDAPWRIVVTEANLSKLKPADGDSRWKFLKAAAAALGISQQGVLQKLNSGKLEVARVRNGRRASWRIHLPERSYDGQPALF